VKQVVPIRSESALERRSRPASVVRDWICAASASFKAICGELMRLNAIGFSARSRGQTRRERAASVRKEIAERYRGHSRCC